MSARRNPDRVEQDREGLYVVYFRGRLCSPTWADKGPALAYLLALRLDKRRPEYAT